jgi:hypothetical protein
MKPFSYFPACLFLAIVGCGHAGSAFSPQDSGHFDVARPAAKAAHPERGEDRLTAAKKYMKVAPSAGESTRVMLSTPVANVYSTAPSSPPQPERTTNVAPGTAFSRKIIYDAQVDLVVDSVDPIGKKVTSLVQAARGYIAEQNVTGSPGTLRSIHWKIRIPVEQFDSFVESIVSLGELERNNRTSEDISDQYYDIEARIKNKKVEEQTLNKILQERSGKLEDILKIEIELSRVRGEIEQLEGKIRVLENLSSLATLTLNVREREKYAPAAPVVAGFSTQISRTWDGQILNLVDLAKAIVLWAVSWAIWLPFLLVALILAWIVGRRLLRAFIRNIPRLVTLARTPLIRPRAQSPGE